MKRQESSATLADGVKKYRVTLTDNPLLPGDNRNLRGQTFLRDMMDQFLLKCGPFGPDQLFMFVKDGAWVIAMEATETQKEG